MFREQPQQQQSMNRNNIPSWHPIHASPSQDMWELPSSSTATSSLELDYSPAFDEEQQDHLEENAFAGLYTASRSTGITVQSTSDSITTQDNKPLVLGDATNTVRRGSQGSPSRTPDRSIRRSQFN